MGIILVPLGSHWVPLGRARAAPRHLGPPGGAALEVTCGKSLPGCTVSSHFQDAGGGPIGTNYDFGESCMENTHFSSPASPTPCGFRGYKRHPSVAFGAHAGAIGVHWGRLGCHFCPTGDPLGPTGGPKGHMGSDWVPIRGPLWYPLGSQSGSIGGLA